MGNVQQKGREDGLTRFQRRKLKYEFNTFFGEWRDRQEGLGYVVEPVPPLSPEISALDRRKEQEILLFHPRRIRTKNFLPFSVLPSTPPFLPGGLN